MGSGSAQPTVPSASRVARRPGGAEGRGAGGQGAGGAGKLGGRPPRLRGRRVAGRPGGGAGAGSAAVLVEVHRRAGKRQAASRPRRFGRLRPGADPARSERVTDAAFEYARQRAASERGPLKQAAALLREGNVSFVRSPPRCRSS